MDDANDDAHLHFYAVCCVCLCVCDNKGSFVMMLIFKLHVINKLERTYSVQAALSWSHFTQITFTNAKNAMSSQSLRTYLVQAALSWFLSTQDQHRRGKGQSQGGE